MPELAEVALFARDLNDLVRGQDVLKVSFPNQKDGGAMICPHPTKETFRTLKSRKIYFRSMGKALWLCCAKKKNPLLEFRLGMTGQFHLARSRGHWQRHYFLTVQLEEGCFHYADPRRFGRISEPRKRGQALGGYSESSGLVIRKVTAVPTGYLRRPKIAWLISSGDQTGVGNYMANEALGRLKLSPFTPCKDLREARKVLEVCGEIAQESFRHGGNSFGTGYYRLAGEEGGYAEFCQFYKNPTVPRHLFGGRPVYTIFPPLAE